MLGAPSRSGSAARRCAHSPQPRAPGPESALRKEGRAVGLCRAPLAPDETPATRRSARVHRVVPTIALRVCTSGRGPRAHRAPPAAPPVRRSIGGGARWSASEQRGAEVRARARLRTSAAGAPARAASACSCIAWMKPSVPGARGCRLSSAKICSALPDASAAASCSTACRSCGDMSVASTESGGCVGARCGCSSRSISGWCRRTACSSSSCEKTAGSVAAAHGEQARARCGGQAAEGAARTGARPREGRRA